MSLKHESYGLISKKNNVINQPAILVEYLKNCLDCALYICQLKKGSKELTVRCILRSDNIQLRSYFFVKIIFNFAERR